MRTLKQHLEQAQNHIKHHGSVSPALIVECKDGKALVFIFADFPDGIDKHKLIFGVGRKVAEMKEFGPVEKIILTTEAWAKSFPKDADLSEFRSGEKRVVDFADKVEIVISTSLDVNSKAEILSTDFIRSGKYIDFSKPKKLTATAGDVMILKRFWEGYLI